MTASMSAATSAERVAEGDGDEAPRAPSVATIGATMQTLPMASAL